MFIHTVWRHMIALLPGVLGVLYCVYIFELLLNIYTFIICGIDKRHSKMGMRRVAESRLLNLALLGGCFGLLLGMFTFRHKTRRVKFIMGAPACCVVWALIMAQVISPLSFDRWIEYKRVTYDSRKIDQSLNGYTIAFISDTHDLPDDDLREVAAKLNGFHIDALLLGGDFTPSSGSPERAMEILSNIRTADGIYGIAGNHDKSKTLFSIMEKYGITMLSNSGLEVRDGMYICGTEDLWNGKPDIARAASGAKLDDFVLLMAHNPDVTMKQDTTGVDLILSGHTHGGQFTVLGIWAPALTLSHNITAYGQRFISGWAKSKDGTDVYVSNGTGSITRAPRGFARPRVIILRLLSINPLLYE